uniref:Uncharacterized protein n=1 Tax=Quercus lobata TaxID=97700 RepID=A0A7N2MQW5_QUELO
MAIMSYSTIVFSLKYTSKNFLKVCKVNKVSEPACSNSDSEESCDGEGNYSAFMTIAPVDSSEDLSTLVEELSEHTEVESMGVGEESDDEDEEYIYEGEKGLQESYNSPLEKIGLQEHTFEVEKKPNVIAQKVLTKPQNPFKAKPKAKGKSFPKSQRGPQTQHFCHHCRVRGHTRPNCHKLQALKNAGP